MIDPELTLVRDAVLAMPMSRTLGVEFDVVERGRVELRVPIAEALTFSPGRLQAAAVFAAADFAAVGAAGTLLPPGWINATVDGTIKLVAPAEGSHLRVVGRVVDAGRTLTVCAADAYAVGEEGERLCATWLGTARNIDLTARLGA